MTAHWRLQSERRNMRFGTGTTASTMLTGNAQAAALAAGEDNGRGWRRWPRLVVAGVSIIAIALLCLLLSFTVVVDGLGLAFVGILGTLGGLGLLGMAWWQSGPRAEMAMLAQLVRQSPDGRLITDDKGNVLYANDVCRSLFALYDGMQVSLPQLFYGNGDGQAAVQRLLGSALAGAERRAEIEFTGDDGLRRWLDIRSHPVGPSTGRAGWYIADVTPQHELREVVREEQARLADFLNNAPVGFFSVDEAGRFILTNDTLAGWLGYRPEELAAGFCLDDVVQGGADALLPPAQAENGDQQISVDVDLRTRDGGEFAAEVTQSLVRDVTGDSWRTRSVVRNLSQERQWATALQLAEHWFRSFFDQAPVAVLLVDREGVISEANAAFRTMCVGGDIVGRPLTEFLAQEEHKEVLRRLGETWSGAPRQDALEVRMTGAAQERMVELYASRLTDADGAVSGLLLHLIDTTTQRSLEMQFAQSQKMQAVGQLAGGVAHDFNNLLTAMIGHCDLLLLKARPGDESFPDIMQVKQNANRAANLVRQLLAFSRQQTLHPKVLSLTDVLAELTHLVRRLIGENIELRIEHGRDLGLVKVDHGQFEQVIINLAVNARDAMIDGGVLQIRTANVSFDESKRLRHDLMQAGEYVLVEVRDTGKGISKADLGRIFEPFFTTKTPGTNTGSGTGLGLSTVFGIIKQTGGYIFPESELGSGTVFSIYLPRHQAESGETETSAQEPERPKDLTGKGRILLVEDEDAVRMFAARALRNKGYTVLEANCGEAAMKVFEGSEEAIDLMISDVVMPNMDGPTLIREVRKQQPDLKVIFISGYAEDAFRKNLDPGSEFELLPKPFSLKQLAGKVKDVIGA